MYQGKYTGTMCLSEPQAGSDVGAGTTSAQSVEEGVYKIKGSKCWISSGDSDLGENVIHAVLARVKGAPDGTKGLSLFVVPHTRVNDDGTLGDWNDVTVASIEDKLGIHASPTVVLNFGENGDCLGWIIGEEGKGISSMFMMMNGARIFTGLIGLSLAGAAYENARTYAYERVQGTNISKIRDLEAPRVTIIEHPAVRLNLINMKAKVEAMRALLYYTVFQLDLQLIAKTDEERQKAQNMVDLLTPMCKGWCTEVGLDVVQVGIQVLGGVGYTKDFPMEQFFRDARIAPIYEGTTDIQALDLVGRKMIQNDGILFQQLMEQFSQSIEKHREHPELREIIEVVRVRDDRAIQTRCFQVPSKTLLAGKAPAVREVRREFSHDVSLIVKLLRCLYGSFSVRPHHGGPVKLCFILFVSHEEIHEEIKPL